ncbi:hypothetical protein [Pseudomonas aeruginosa]|uniref:hypothetical protein n=1 Tax=Pseudomonas aeruginosa TaxID=287 RepID=UPI001BCA0DFF|nr:hypothetical protein [Pseudomonas aeruginosa]
MSLETQIAALVTAANNLTGAVNGKMAQIDQEVAAAVGAVPAEINKRMAMAFYVDAINGSDGNSGETWALAKKTVAAAVSSAPRGSLVSVWLKSGQVHSMAADVDTAQKTVLVYGDGYVYNNRATYVELRSEPWVMGDGTMAAAGFRVGVRGFVALAGIKMTTAQFTAEHAGKANPIWQTSYFRTGGAQGTVKLEHCQVDLYNGAMAYQHSGGSIGVIDLLMRNVLINKVDLAGLPVTTGNQQMMGTYANHPVPFSMFGIELVRQGAVANWGELITQDLTNARTNISLTA